MMEFKNTIIEMLNNKRLFNLKEKDTHLVCVLLLCTSVVSSLLPAAQHSIMHYQQHALLILYGIGSHHDEL
jgi:hypothetical protein